ncbi:hypothetical protein DY000_02025631 [Brassica cretica]|uniref:Uncharacterized protein n=1 Tax=Brassica cretica TaxID=69181 RepID=A0ABQ7EJT1_BRACR|nr:hypothetical protein DY000_02025631 [Brassica cretica]
METGPELRHGGQGEDTKEKHEYYLSGRTKDSDDGTLAHARRQYAGPKNRSTFSLLKLSLCRVGFYPCLNFFLY